MTRTFKIERPDERLRPAIQDKIDNLNKPKGSLGVLEELAMQVCLVQQTLTPSLANPCHLLLGGDHGIEREGVSVSLYEPAMSEEEFDKAIEVGASLVDDCIADGCRVLCIQLYIGFREKVNREASPAWCASRLLYRTS